LQNSHEITSDGISWPILRTVIDAKQFYNLILNSVNDNIGKAGENQLASPNYSPLATNMWELSQVRAAIVQRSRNIRRCLRIILSNVLNDIVEVAGGGGGPTYAH
jgi:hypothetical protein